MTPVAEAVAAFAEEVQHLAGRGVSRRRRGRRWEFRIPLRSRRFSFDERGFRLGSGTARLANTPLRIARVDVQNQQLRLVLEEVAAAEREFAEAASLVAEAERVLSQIKQDPLRTVFARRAFRGIGRLVTEASVESLAAAAEAPTDAEVVLRAFEHPETLSVITELDPLAPAKLRGLRERERLLSLEGGTWDATHVAQHLHLTRQGVNRRRRAGALLAVDVGRRGYRFPAWQFVRSGTLAGLEATLAALREHDPWMQLSFMLNANPRLNGKTPLDALRTGGREQVEAAAQAFGEHGAA